MHRGSEERFKPDASAFLDYSVKRYSSALKSIVSGKFADTSVNVPVPLIPILWPSHPGPRTKLRVSIIEMRAASTYVKPLIPKSCPINAVRFFLCGSNEAKSYLTSFMTIHCDG
jgi:hypothetical protein